MSTVSWRKLLAVLVLGLLGWTGAARAQPPPQVEVSIADELILPEDEIRPAVRDADGQLITRPGDVIQYTLTATNTGAGAAHGVELVDPIPDGTEYVLNSAQGEGMEISCSIDGGHTYHPQPVLMEVRLPDGSTAWEEAPARQYTHVRWALTTPIDPGATVAARLRVRVIAGEAAAAEEEE